MPARKHRRPKDAASKRAAAMPPSVANLDAAAKPEFDEPNLPRRRANASVEGLERRPSGTPEPDAFGPDQETPADASDLN